MGAKVRRQPDPAPPAPPAPCGPAGYHVPTDFHLGEMFARPQLVMYHADYPCIPVGLHIDSACNHMYRLGSRNLNLDHVWTFPVCSR